jgi:hypothetical protein
MHFIHKLLRTAYSRLYMHVYQYIYLVILRSGIHALYFRHKCALVTGAQIPERKRKNV